MTFRVHFADGTKRDIVGLTPEDIRAAAARYTSRFGRVLKIKRLADAKV